MLVVADGDGGRAQSLADALAAEVWAMREAASTPFDTIDGALDAALASDDPRPMVLADTADNAGAGAPSDNTAILARLVARKVKGAALGMIWDPGAVGICHEAGLGATFDLRVGGKCGVTSGEPVDLRVTVRGLSDDHSQGGLSGGRAHLGPAAWVEAEDGIHLVLTHKRQQPFAPDAFTGLGLTLADKRIVVVKSMQHFYAGFSPIASSVRYVAAPGAVPPDYGAIPYTKRDLAYWPRVADPFSGMSPEAAR